MTSRLVDTAEIHYQPTIRELADIAKKHGGRLLSETYQGSRGKLKWKCDKGHTWSAAPYNVKRGTWCPFCCGNVRKSIEDVRELAFERGYQLISRSYRGTHRKLKWRCRKDHEWEATPSRIAEGTGCPKCAGTYRDIDDVRKFASNIGYFLLSHEYINNCQKLEFRCPNGHQFEMSWVHFRRAKTACPKCRKKSRARV